MAIIKTFLSDSQLQLKGSRATVSGKQKTILFESRTHRLLGCYKHRLSGKQLSKQLDTVLEKIDFTLHALIRGGVWSRVLRTRSGGFHERSDN